MEVLNSQVTFCSLCSLQGQQIKLSTSDYIKHIRLFHEYQPNFQFTCGINGCPRSYHNVGTFKNHVSEVHADLGSSSTSDSSSGDWCELQSTSSSSTGDAEVNPLEDTDSSDTDVEYYGEDTTETTSFDLPPCSMDALQKSSAVFLLGLKEKFKLTQVAIQEIVEGVTSLTQKRISILCSQVAIEQFANIS